MNEDEVIAALGDLRQRVLRLGEPFLSVVVRWLLAVVSKAERVFQLNSGGGQCSRF